MRIPRNPSVFDGPNQWVDPVDPRHVGRIVKLDGQNVATVRWLETGWLSERPLAALERLPAAEWVPGVGHVAC